MRGGSTDLGRTVRPDDAGRDVLAARALQAWTAFAEEPAPAAPPRSPEEAEVDEVLQEFGGDFRAALRGLLHDLAVLAGDFGAAVSRGYMRGGLAERGRRVRRAGHGEPRA